MSHKQKEIVISLISAILVTFPYFFYVISRFESETMSTADELKFWAAAVLWLIPLRIVSLIILHIVISIVYGIFNNGKLQSEITDERESLIGYKSTRNSYYAHSAGLLLAMLSIVAGYSVPVMFTILLMSGIAAELAEYVSQFYYYNKGV